MTFTGPSHRVGSPRSRPTDPTHPPTGPPASGRPVGRPADRPAGSPARQPGSPPARQPGSPAARQPGSPAARQPGSWAWRHAPAPREWDKSHPTRRFTRGSCVRARSATHILRTPPNQARRVRFCSLPRHATPRPRSRIQTPTEPHRPHVPPPRTQTRPSPIASPGRRAQPRYTATSDLTATDPHPTRR
jgi:hypothetical protein